jgi:type II secretory pathway pseudopilin PulG
MKIYAVITAVASLVSLVGSWMANLAAHESVLLIALAALFVQWHAQRRRQVRTSQQRAQLATMRSLSEEAALLSCSQVATSHPELRCELRIFERTVVRCLADLHHGRSGAPALPVIQHCVKVVAPTLLAAVQTYDDKLTLQSVCRQFRQTSERLTPRIPNGVSAPDTQFALGGELSNHGMTVGNR